ncbi:MAG: META domain-containing protein [Solirubrobacterales bacterium]|nr:META domain-containing protein [Solirubrobacterales bacterium]
MKHRGKTLAFTILLLILAGTLPATGAAAKAPTTKWLLGKQFRSVRVAGPPVLEGRTFGLRFLLASNFSNQPERPTLRVAGGCNTWSARFRIRKGRLFVFGAAMSTKIGCPVDPDHLLRSKLRKGMLIRLKDGRLIVTRPAERIRFDLKRISPKTSQVDEPDPTETPDPEPRITVPATMEDVQNKRYEMLGITGHDLGAPLKVGFWTGPLQRKDDEGKQVIGPGFGFQLDCNFWGGEYAIEDGIFFWKDVISTLALCEGSQEMWLYRFLKGEPEIGLDGTDLVLRKDGVEIVLQEIPN